MLWVRVSVAARKISLSVSTAHLSRPEHWIEERPVLSASHLLYCVFERMREACTLHCAAVKPGRYVPV